jgi:hypothetical protein
MNNWNDETWLDEQRLADSPLRSLESLQEYVRTNTDSELFPERTEERPNPSPSDELRSLADIIREANDRIDRRHQRSEEPDPYERPAVDFASMSSADFARVVDASRGIPLESADLDRAELSRLVSPLLQEADDDVE